MRVPRTCLAAGENGCRNFPGIAAARAVHPHHRELLQRHGGGVAVLLGYEDPVRLWFGPPTAREFLPLLACQVAVAGRRVSRRAHGKQPLSVAPASPHCARQAVHGRFRQQILEGSLPPVWQTFYLPGIEAVGLATPGSRGPSAKNGSPGIAPRALAGSHDHSFQYVVPARHGVGGQKRCRAPKEDSCCREGRRTRIVRIARRIRSNSSASTSYACVPPCSAAYPATPE